MKKIAILLIAILLFAGGFMKLKQTKSTEENEIIVAGKKLQVEIMRTAREKERGLSDRKNLCSNCGLLFLYEEEGIYSFWMRRMYFDIDILWIAKNKIVDITYGAKKPDEQNFESPKEIYQSKVPADKVLEVNAGWTEENRIKIGDEIVQD